MELICLVDDQVVYSTYLPKKKTSENIPFDPKILDQDLF